MATALMGHWEDTVSWSPHLPGSEHGLPKCQRRPGPAPQTAVHRACVLGPVSRKCASTSPSLRTGRGCSENLVPGPFILWLHDLGLLLTRSPRPGHSPMDGGHRLQRAPQARMGEMPGADLPSPWGSREARGRSRGGGFLGPVDAWVLASPTRRLDSPAGCPLCEGTSHIRRQENPATPPRQEPGRPGHSAAPQALAGL